MPRKPGAGRALDLQCLKQATHCIGQAISLFIKREDKEAIAQVKLAGRFLDEFVDNQGG